MTVYACKLMLGGRGYIRINSQSAVIKWSPLVKQKKDGRKNRKEFDVNVSIRILSMLPSGAG